MNTVINLLVVASTVSLIFAGVSNILPSATK